MRYIVNPITGDLVPGERFSFTPTGNVESNNLKDAIAELDAEKLSAGENLADVLNKILARTNLEAASSGENTDITRLSPPNNYLPIVGGVSVSSNALSSSDPGAGNISVSGTGLFSGNLRLQGALNSPRTLTLDNSSNVAIQNSGSIVFSNANTTAARITTTITSGVGEGTALEFFIRNTRIVSYAEGLAIYNVPVLYNLAASNLTIDAAIYRNSGTPLGSNIRTIFRQVDASGANFDSAAISCIKTNNNAGFFTSNLAFNVTQTNVLTEALRVTGTGVGIGTTTPGAKLQVAGGGVAITSSISAATDPGAGNLFVSGSGSFGTGLTINSSLPNIGIFNSTNPAQGRIIVNHNSNSDFEIQNASSGKWTLASYRPSGTNFSFTLFNQQANATGDAFFINGDTNRVGIGTNTPGTRLQITGGLAVTSSTNAASDPGAGNLSVSGNITCTNLDARGEVSGIKGLNTANCKWR